MMKPRINNDTWALTQSYIAPDGEEMWNLYPNEGEWAAVLHLQQSGKMYVTILRNRNRSDVDREIIANALKELSEWVYNKKGIRTSIGVVATSSNARLFSTVRMAGFKKLKQNHQIHSNGLKLKRRLIVFEYKPTKERENV